MAVKKTDCKNCGACPNHDLCECCGCCRSCGKRPLNFQPYYIPWVTPYWTTTTTAGNTTNVTTNNYGYLGGEMSEENGWVGNSLTVDEDDPGGFPGIERFLCTHGKFNTKAE